MTAAMTNTQRRAPKPYPTFELFPHAKGYWCKKIDGQQVPFGKWELPRSLGGDDAAYERSWRDAKARYNKLLEDQANGLLLAGRPERMSVSQLCDAYLAHLLTRDNKKSTFCAARRNVTAFRDFVGPASTIADLERFDPTRPSESKVMQYIDSLRHFSWDYYNRRIGAISGLWNWAED